MIRLLPALLLLAFLAACAPSATEPTASPTGAAPPSTPSSTDPTAAPDDPTRPTAEKTSAPDPDARQTLYDLIDPDSDVAQLAYARVLGAEDTRFIAAFLELMRMNSIGGNYNIDFVESVGALEALSGESFGGDWAAWIEWYGTTDLAPPPGFTGWKGRLLGVIDPGFEAFLQDDFPATIRVEEILWGGVRVDGIPALDNADMIPAAEADYLEPDEPVFGISLNGDSRAYPLRILDWHEMANDVVGGVPVSLAYCTLCGAGVAYHGELDGTTYTFGSSGFLFRSNKLMYDRQTRTLWNQLTGEPVLGKLAGSGIRLDLLPVVVSTWADWQAQHPDTQVLSLDTGFARPYDPGAAYGDYFSFYDTMFPVWQRSDLLDTKARVYALQIEGVPIAYPVDTLVEEGVVNHAVAGQPLVLIALRGGILVDGVSLRTGDVRYDAGAEVRSYERGEYEFAAGPDGDGLLDQDGGAWQITEEALLGPGGEQLARIPGHLAYWFGWFAFFPNTLVYEAPSP